MRTAGESFFESEGDRLDGARRLQRCSHGVLSPWRATTLITLGNCSTRPCDLWRPKQWPRSATAAISVVASSRVGSIRLTFSQRQSFVSAPFSTNSDALSCRPLSSVAITKQLKMVSARRRKSEPDRRTRDPPLPSFGVAEDGRATHSHKPSHPSRGILSSFPPLTRIPSGLLALSGLPVHLAPSQSARFLL